MRKREKRKEKNAPRDARGGNMEKRIFYALTAQRTRRGPRLRESAAGETRVFNFHIRRREEKCVAHTKKKRPREDHSMALYGGKDARATPPRRVPREKSVSSSQMH